MEDIYTIKIRTNPDPRDLYPSERRYSATTALGLGVVHLALAITALLLASLSLTHVSTQHNSQQIQNRYENFTDFENPANISEQRKIEIDHRNDDIAFLDEELNEDASRTVIIDENFQLEHPFVTLALAPCFMSAGALAAGLAGLFAWKRWYVDQSIRWFFSMSSLSIITSFGCLITTGFMLGQQSRNSPLVFTLIDNNIYVDQLKNHKQPNVRFVLGINLLIASTLEFIWSIMSAKLSWKGMRNDYPEDLILARGKLQVNTIQKGNKMTKTIAPDILNHHPTKRKFAKYFPKNKDNKDYLPKAESHIEYQERVNKFLEANLNENDR